VTEAFASLSDNEDRLLATIQALEEVVNEAAALLR
jgi:hypothetical protein